MIRKEYKLRKILLSAAGMILIVQGTRSQNAIKEVSISDPAAIATGTASAIVSRSGL